MSEAAFVRKINAAPPPDIWTEGDTYEDWTTTGMPHVGVSEGKSYQVELTATGKAVWRETVVPDLSQAALTSYKDLRTTGICLRCRPAKVSQGCIPLRSR